jgi:hypothetical protein
MYTLANDSLEISILDPIADRERFGVRYCTGGYIFQVTDARLGPLMSGPTYPDTFNWFDGQGIPDAFNLCPLTDPASSEPVALILGIGLCNTVDREVVTFCEWDVSEQGNSITMLTAHTYASYDVALERTVTLSQRTIRSFTCVTNRGKQPIPMRWFPHPFYPQPETDELLKLNLPLGPIDHEAYRMGDNGFICRKGWPWGKGYYLPLDHSGTSNLTLLQKHPKLGLVAAMCSFAPTYFPIWGNPRTFSWEPFFERTIGMGQTVDWYIDYEF